MSSKRILFIGHEASISGAPVLLLNLLLLCKSHGMDISLVVVRGGPFIETYRKHFPVLVMKPVGYGREKNAFKRAGNVLLNRFKLLLLLAKANTADIIFSNTIVNGRLLKQLRIFRSKMITYVHELDKVIESYIASGDAALSLRYTQQFAYPSMAVKETLQHRYNIADSRLHRLSYYFPVNLELLGDEEGRQSFKNAFIQRFNLNASFIVGGMGLVSSRKGTDIFISVCEKVVRQNQDIQFCWIGAFENSEIEQEMRNMIAQKKLEPYFCFTGALPPHLFNTAAFNLLFLSSREDPYPLVVLEAGFMKVPSICFAGSGGIAEFVGEDAGWIVPQFSEEAAADVILELYAKPEQLEAKARVAMHRSQELHANKDRILNQFDDLINQI